MTTKSRLNRRNIAMLATFALYINVSGQIFPSVKNDLLIKSSENKFNDSKKSIYDILYMDKIDTSYSFIDHNLIIEQYDNIPTRNKNKPSYETLLFDDSNNYFCYVFSQTGDGLRNAFRKSHKILTDNEVDDKNPYLNETKLPPLFPKKMPEGSVLKEYPLGYKILNETLTKGRGSIRRIWNAKGHKVEASFDKNEYIIKIYP